MSGRTHKTINKKEQVWEKIAGVIALLIPITLILLAILWPFDTALGGNIQTSDTSIQILK